MKLDKIKGALFGLAIGDAFGGPVEFMEKGTFSQVLHYESGGKFKLEKGEWTDDTSHMLALIDSLLDKHGFEPEDFRDKLFGWLYDGKYTTRGRQIGAGKLTMKSLFSHRMKGTAISPFNLDKHSGNGSIMRLAPIPLYYSKFGLAEVLKYSGESSIVSHSSDLCVQSCQYLGGILYHLLNGRPKNDVFQIVKELDRTLGLREEFKLLIMEKIVTPWEQYMDK